MLEILQLNTGNHPLDAALVLPFHFLSEADAGVPNKCYGNGAGFKYAHPSDCTKFIICISGGAFVIQDCPGGLHYSPKLQMCDHSYLVDCKVGPPAVPHIKPPFPETGKDVHRPKPHRPEPHQPEPYRPQPPGVYYINRI